MTDKPQLTLSYLKKMLAHYYWHKGAMPEQSWMLQKVQTTPEQLEKYLNFLRQKQFLIEGPSGEMINPEKYSVKDVAGEDHKAPSIPAEVPPVDDASFSAMEQFAKQTPFCAEEVASSASALSQLDFKEQKSAGNFTMRMNAQFVRALRWIMLVIGIGATYMSIFYTFEWLQSFLNGFNAALLSGVMVLYGVASFELIALFYLRNKRILAGFFAALWLVVTCFSMASTVAGQYTGRVEAIRAEYAAQADIRSQEQQRGKWAARKSTVERQLAIAEAEDSRLAGLLAGFSDISTMNEQRGLYYELIISRNQNSNRKAELHRQLEQLLEEEPEEGGQLGAPDFYSWLGSLFGIDPGKIQFWLSVFPALFIDLIAPFSFAVVMFMRPEEEEEKV